MLQCSACDGKAIIRPSWSKKAVCKDCFFEQFEKLVLETVEHDALLIRGKRVAVGASGGKDSSVLSYVLAELNRKHDLGLELVLVSIDEGIQGYRDDSLEAVKRSRRIHNLPLTILSYKNLYGWTMDEIVSKIGPRNNCTFCGVFRRRALERGASVCNADVLVTGHNADDNAETVLLNLLRGDVARLQRSTDGVTDRSTSGLIEDCKKMRSENYLPRTKPLKYTSQKDIVLYAHLMKLDYFSTECKYAPDAFRGYVREYVKKLENVRPGAIHGFIKSGEAVAVRNNIATVTPTSCRKCGNLSSLEVCKACLLLEGLSTNDYNLGIKKLTLPSRDDGRKNGKICSCSSIGPGCF